MVAATKVNHDEVTKSKSLVAGSLFRFNLCHNLSFVDCAINRRDFAVKRWQILVIILADLLDLK